MPDDDRPRLSARLWPFYIRLGGDSLGWMPPDQVFHDWFTATCSGKREQAKFYLAREHGRPPTDLEIDRWLAEPQSSRQLAAFCETVSRIEIRDHLEERLSALTESAYKNY